jgi:hypothetical protein
LLAITGALRCGEWRAVQALERVSLPFCALHVWSGRNPVPVDAASAAPFDALDRRVELQQRLNVIPEVDIQAEALDKRPSIPLSVLARADHLETFLTTMDWALEQPCRAGKA